MTQNEKSKLMDLRDTLFELILKMPTDPRLLQVLDLIDEVIG